jgi:hypothetical protein
MSSNLCYSHAVEADVYIALRKRIGPFEAHAIALWTTLPQSPTKPFLMAFLRGLRALSQLLTPSRASDGLVQAVGICPLRHTAPSVVRHGSRGPLQFGSKMNRRPIYESVGRRSKSADTPPSTKENWRRICGRWAGRISGSTPAGVESASSSRNGNAALRAEIVGFDLAAHFLHAIVVFVDFMTFQTRNMRDAAEKLAGAVDSIRLCGIDTISFLLQRFSCNYFEISILGV